MVTDLEVLSFRDPHGFVFRSGDRIFRCVYPAAAAGVSAFLGSEVCAQAIGSGHLVRSRVLAREEARDIRSRAGFPDTVLLIEHDAVRFPSYPYEWAQEMLCAAGHATLDVGEAALAGGYALKDATPYNILFEGARPVFIDLLSFEQRDPLAALWRPYAQFVRTFIYPLLANHAAGVQMSELLPAHREGVAPERMLRMLPRWRRLLPPALGLVTMPALLGRSSQAAPETYRARRARTPAEAAFLLRRAYRRARRALARVAPREHAQTAASRYMEEGHNYSAAELAEKREFVADAMREFRPATLLDVGCNTGQFSEMAAASGAAVVAIDCDAVSIGKLWRRASAAGLDILPLVIDIARPSPALGWANQELPSFLSRAAGRFDCVLMLALLHHLLVSERATLPRVVDLAAGLTTDLLLIEYVDREDVQFRRIARGRDALHADFSLPAFEDAVGARFDIVRFRQSTPTRRLYVLRRKPPAAAGAN